MAFILEDKRDYGDANIDIPTESIRGVGTQGIISFVTNLPNDEGILYYEALLNRCPRIKDIPSEMQTIIRGFCSDMERGHEVVPQYSEGDHVLFSKFNEQIVYYENGKETIYYSVPIQSILGVIKDV
jgi:co-chaperonin GroES (HSP10)